MMSYCKQYFSLISLVFPPSFSFFLCLSLPAASFVCSMERNIWFGNFLSYSSWNSARKSQPVDVRPHFLRGLRSTKSVLRIRIGISIRIRLIHMFLDLPDPDTLARLLYDFLSVKNHVNVPSKSNKPKNCLKMSWRLLTKIAGSGSIIE